MTSWTIPARRIWYRVPNVCRNCRRKPCSAAESVSFLAPELIEESDDDAPSGKDEVLEGLHAKLFVIDRGWDASIFSGSFNATAPCVATQRRVHGRTRGQEEPVRSGAVSPPRERRDKLCRPAQDIRRELAVSAGRHSQRSKLDDLLQAMKRAIAAAGPRLVVTAADEKDLFDMRLEWEKLPRWPKGAVEMRAWPITQQAGAGAATRQI